MRFKLIRNGEVLEQPERAKPTSRLFEAAQQPQSEETWPGAVGRNIGSGLLKGAQNVVDLSRYFYRPEEVAEKFGPLPEHIKQNIKQPLAQKFGVSEEFTKPRNWFEEIGQGTISKAPPTVAAVLSGGGGLPALLKSLGIGALGSTAKTVAKEFGQPEWAQSAAELGTEIGAGLATGNIPTLTSKARQGYGEIKKLPASQQAAVPQINKSIKETEDLLKTEVSGKITDKVQSAVNKIGNLINKSPKLDSAGQIIKDAAGNPIVSESASPRQLFDARKSLYRLQKELPLHAREYIKPLTDGINNFFAEYGTTNPEWYKHLSSSDKFWQLKSMQSSLGDMVEKYLPVATKGEVGPFISQTMGRLVGSTVGGVEKFLRRIYQSPVAREHYFDVFKSIVQQDPTAAKEAVDSLADMFGEQPTVAIPSKREEKKVGKFKIIRNGSVIEKKE